MGLYDKNGVRLMAYDLPDDVYTNDQPIKTSFIKDTQWIEETKSVVLVLDEDVVVIETGETVGTLCLVIPHDKVEKIWRPMDELSL